MGGGSFPQPVGNHDTARLRRPSDRSAHRVGRAWFNVPSVGKKLLRVVLARLFVLLSFLRVIDCSRVYQGFLARMSAMQLLRPSRPKVTLICHGDDASQSPMELAKTVLSRTRPSTSSAAITEMDCRPERLGTTLPALRWSAPAYPTSFTVRKAYRASKRRLDVSSRQS